MLIFSFSTGDDAVLTIPPAYKGGEIVVVFLGMSNGHPRVGFKADRSITIDRGKIHRRKQLESGIEVNGNVG
jgi:hypothetical protein